MKECPSCRSRYTDVTLRFCLADGTQLIDVGGSRPGDLHTEETIAMRPDPGTIASRPHANTTQQSVPNPIGAGSSVSLLKIVVIAAVVLFGGLLVVGGAGAAFYLWSRNVEPKRTEEIAFSTPQPVASPTAESTTGDKEIAKTLEEFQRMLEESQDGTTEPEWPLVIPGYSTSTRRAVVNSPRDGFLALRSMPNADIGERLAEIPHDTEFTVGTCLIDATVSGRKGKWCLASYDDETGWIFDGFVTYQSGPAAK